MRVQLKFIPSTGAVHTFQMYILDSTANEKVSSLSWDLEVVQKILEEIF